ncbi:HNH endonuclease [Streptomyces sp. H27-D2]|uniref:HNH endonuclease n=1 Tax=Streptomyces sp. H27-D2 TaxID=3046304 RepID=UPI002DBC2AFD|nr:HNH endonuclease signature motif containing protein [Streptomyces sp. H27-D2]MEC4015230.1 HNH endonuclease signature motif containing protein [Streptomyces sp. H27-D2]
MTTRGTLSAPRKRARKAQLAARDGLRCTYCRRPFASLREATLDHVAPLCLLRTWSARHLVLACRPCNDAKADRLPLFLALLLCAYADRSRPTVNAVNTPTVNAVNSVNVIAVNSVNAVNAQGVHRASPVFPGPAGYAGWLALALLAAARESAARSVRDLHQSTPIGRGDAPDRSGGCTRLRTPTVRPDYLRAPAPVRACPTDRGVAA